MYIFLKVFVLFGSLVASTTSDKLSANLDYVNEDCGDVQHNVDNGIIKLPNFSDGYNRNINCTWTYVASPGRKLLVKIDNVRLAPVDIRTSTFQLYVDDELYDISQNCVKCLKETVGGQTIRVLYSSFVLSALNDNSSDILTDFGSFQVRYKSFDPYRCSKPETIENGFIVSKGRKVGQTISYRCNPPYDLIGDFEAQCITPTLSPLPEWNNAPPRCLIQNCTDGPIIKDSPSGAISSPGYPTYVHRFTTPCVWVITTQFNQQIKLSLTYLKLPQQEDNASFSVLSLIDGDSNYIANLTGPLKVTPLNLTTASNKLTIKFVVNHKDTLQSGFYLEYSSISNSCPKPSAPSNGEVIAYSSDLGSVVAYRCDKGFVLVGELHAECLLTGQWSHPPPTCEPLTGETPIFVSASNDTDIVSAKFPLREGPLVSPPKPSRNSKKRMKLLTSKPSPSPDEALRNKSLGTDSSDTANSVNERTGEAKNSKKNSKENGPKSEPHLFQVIPPKDGTKKSVGNNIDGRSTTNLNATRPDGQIQDLETDTNEEKTSKRHPLLTVTMISIIAGVGAPLTVGIILLVVIILYRKKYPVRMRFGRKFSTFENPVYITKDAHHPKELKSLTK